MKPRRCVSTTKGDRSHFHLSLLCAEDGRVSRMPPAPLSQFSLTSSLKASRRTLGSWKRWSIYWMSGARPVSYTRTPRTGEIIHPFGSELGVSSQNWCQQPWSSPLLSHLFWLKRRPKAFSVTKSGLRCLLSSQSGRRCHHRRQARTRSDKGRAIAAGDPPSRRSPGPPPPAPRPKALAFVCLCMRGLDRGRQTAMWQTFSRSLKRWHQQPM
jgi:hypothetical protein